MNRKNIFLAGVTFLFFSAVPLMAQDPGTTLIPKPGCTSTKAELDATRQAAINELHTPGEAKFNFIDPSYLQHNPARVKQAKEDNLNDYQELHKAFVPAAGSAPAAAPAGPKPPKGGTVEIVTAECDIVTIVRNNFRQDPTQPPGNFYEYFTFDTYRIKNGKVVEHWDQNLINPPAPSGKGQ